MSEWTMHGFGDFRPDERIGLSPLLDVVPSTAGRFDGVDRYNNRMTAWTLRDAETFPVPSLVFTPKPQGDTK